MSDATAAVAKLHHPWLVAVWPGMGQVAMNAGVYLLVKLNMTIISELTAHELFDIGHVDVKAGILQLGRRPRNRFFVWQDPNKRHDLVLFIGEAQPPSGKYAFCRLLVQYAQHLGIERIFTFAAMATEMRPADAERVFVAATDDPLLNEFQDRPVETLQDGNIGGLNGLLLGVAAEADMKGACLLGEMPHVFSQLPYPKASLGILKIFTSLAGITVDFAELSAQADLMDERLNELWGQLEQAYGQQAQAVSEAEQQGFQPEPSEEQLASAAEKRRIEHLFEQATLDRSRAFELKQELDRIGLFKEYEDRFLDLFKKPAE